MSSGPLYFGKYGDGAQQRRPDVPGPDTGPVGDRYGLFPRLGDAAFPWPVRMRHRRAAAGRLDVWIEFEAGDMKSDMDRRLLAGRGRLSAVALAAATPATPNIFLQDVDGDQRHPSDNPPRTC